METIVQQPQRSVVDPRRVAAPMTRGTHERRFDRTIGIDGSLGVLFEPSLSEAERTVAALEGWILGIR